MYAAFGWVDALVLGLVQGLTEFLPFLPARICDPGAAVAGGGDPGAAFTAITQLGTELAVLIYFRRDVMRMLLAWWRSLPRLGREALSVDAKVAWLVILAPFRFVCWGLLLRDLIETTFRTLLLTAIMLIVFGVIFGLGRKAWQPNAQHRPADRERWRAAGLGPGDGLDSGGCRARAAPLRWVCCWG